MKLGDYETHPAADLLPLLKDDELHELVESIREHGQLEPILIIQGKVPLVIDGRNRLRACLELGLEPIVKPYRGRKDMGAIADFVRVRNLHRRHLCLARRIMITVDLDMLAEQADASRRRRATQNNHAAKAEVACVPPQDSAKTREALAAKAGVSPRSMQSGMNVKKYGTPELIEAIHRDGLAIFSVSA